VRGNTLEEVTRGDQGDRGPAQPRADVKRVSPLLGGDQKKNRGRPPFFKSRGVLLYEGDQRRRGAEKSLESLPEERRLR